MTKPDDDQHAGPDHRSLIATARAWLGQIDPGAHRRIKGLRLVTTYGIAAMLGTLSREIPCFARRRFIKFFGWGYCALGERLRGANDASGVFP